MMFYRIFSSLINEFGISNQLQQQQIKTMMQSIRATPKNHRREEGIEPWTNDEFNIASIILESSEYSNSKRIGNPLNTNPQVESKTGNVRKQATLKSYNFYDNLRKYEIKKAHQMMWKQETNFIERNKKELSEDFNPLFDEKGKSTISKVLQEKAKIGRRQIGLEATVIQPAAWSMIMYYQTEKNERRNRHKDIPSFLRQRSRKNKERPLQKMIGIQMAESVIQQTEADKYQKILKLKQGLRRKNTKSALKSKRPINNALNIDESFDIRERRSSPDNLRQFQHSSQSWRSNKRPMTLNLIQRVSKSSQQSRRSEILQIHNPM